MKRNCLRLLAGAAAAVICTQPFSVRAWAELEIINFGEVYYPPEYEELIEDGYKLAQTGKCGDHLSYVIDDEGTLTISGTGKMYNYDVMSTSDAPWNRFYRENEEGTLDWSAVEENVYIHKIIIEEGVESIGDAAFTDFQSLESVEFPDSMTVIGAYSFDRCGKLAEVNVPDSVLVIGEQAFRDTAWYDNQPEGIVYANRVAYALKADATDMTEFVIRDGTVSLSDGLFYGTAEQGYYNEFDRYQYGYSKEINSIVVPDSVVRIGNRVFSDYKYDESYSALEDKAWWKEQPDGVVYIGKVAFGYKGEIPEHGVLTFREDTVGIADGAFSGFEKVIIPKSVKYIGKGAFYGEELAEIEIQSPDCVFYDSACDFLNEAIWSEPWIKDEPELAASYDYDITVDLNAQGANLELDLFGGFDEAGEADGFWHYFNFTGTLRGYKNSTTEAYAKKYNYRFEPLPEPEYITGDPDGDGAVTINDALCALEICNYLNMDMADEISEAAMNAADVDGNGRVELSDAIYILTYLNFNDVMDTPTTWEEILQM